MKNTKETKIDIVSSILEVIESKQYKENINYDKKFIEHELKPVVAYYLKEDIETIFGRTEFDSDEIDIIATQEGLIVENIFNEPLNIHCVKTQVGPKIVGLLGNKEVFRIEHSVDTLSNRIMDANGVVTVYKANVETNEFTLYQGEAYDFYVNENDLSYISKLSTFNAKIKEFETFELTRIKPVVEKSDSLLMRIIDNVTNDNYVRIATSNELVNASLFADRIFTRMKEIKAKDEEKQIKMEQLAAKLQKRKEKKKN